MKHSSIYSVVLRTLVFPVLAVAASCSDVEAQQDNRPSLTIYNQNFGVVREVIPLDLKQGINTLSFTEITAHLEPDSIVLRDPTGKRQLSILEQNYRADPISQGLLLNHYEGETIPFEVGDTTVMGKIIRSGYQMHNQQSLQRFGNAYYQRQMTMSNATQPIVEIDGVLRFGLPGMPLFPNLKDDTILKPTLNWTLQTDQEGSFDAEMSYVTSGMTWEADYNIVAPEKGDTVDLIGWVTMENQSGRTFEDARIKLMAGDVNKLQPDQRQHHLAGAMMRSEAAYDQAAPVSEKSFDEFHLYSLNRITTLRDRETKQVEFVRAEGVKSKRVFVYRGAAIDWNRYRGRNAENLRNDQGFGTNENTKIWVMREFMNSEENQLGMPLPKGRTRFYREDEANGTLEFVGENIIDHTPKDELVKVYTGNSFDLVGGRKRTSHNLNNRENWLDESFEISLRNRKDEDVTIRVVEDLYRWPNWEIKQKSHEFTKTDSQTIQFDVKVPANSEIMVSYLVHYSWD